jgi:hypothetical protein
VLDQLGILAHLRGSGPQRLRDAAIDLVRTFGLEPVPRPGTEKRNS